MNPKLARLLTRLYPRAWRERFGKEFEEFLQDSDGGFRASANVVCSALYERIVPTRGANIGPKSQFLSRHSETPQRFSSSRNVAHSPDHAWHRCNRRHPSWSAWHRSRAGRRNRRPSLATPDDGPNANCAVLCNQVAAPRPTTDAGRPGTASRSVARILCPRLFPQFVNGACVVLLQSATSKKAGHPIRRPATVFYSQPYFLCPALLVLPDPVDHPTRYSNKLPRLGSKVFQNQVRRKSDRPVLLQVEVDAAAQRRHRLDAVRVQPDL